MTLISRVSRFFLFALAAMLLGYSLLLFGLARYTLYREFDQQLQAALNTLVAAIEVESDDVKWEPSDHTVTLGSEEDSDEARWVVTDENGKVIDRSTNLQHTAEEEVLILDYARSAARRAAVPRIPSDWRFLQMRLAAPAPKSVAERDPREFAVLIVTVARSTAGLQRTLNGLAGLVLGVSIIVWLIAAVCGRWFCRKALEPVGAMAASARTMGPANPRQRLPIATSGDELSDLGHAFNGLLDQLFQAFERQQRFARDAAHQLRTPLTVLQGQIEVALRRPRTAAEYSETLGLLNEQVVEFRQTVESLLFLARAEDEGERPKLTSVDLASWLADYLRKWQSNPRYADLCCNAREPLSAWVSLSLLTQLLDNLVGNALKYSPPGTPITISLQRCPEGIALEVADQGMGIASEDVASIFEPFFRSENARRSGIAGTGLGLALASRIATALNGRLTCDSTLNAGSRFTLFLPIA